MAPILEINNLYKNYGATEVLKDINVSIDKGEFLVLVGPSGCGKSTLLNCIAGLEPISGGTLRIDGHDMTHVSPKDRDIAMVFQSYALYPTMSVAKNITFGMKVRGVDPETQKSKLAEVARQLQIEPFLNRRPGQLSGGQRQRVAMGRALVRDPKLFLFDEPLSNLDAKLRVEMRTEIKLMHQRLKTTTVYVTHDQIEAMTLGDKVAVMKDGVIQQFGTPHEIYNDPANLFVASFIGSPPMNFVPLRIRQRDGRWVGVLNSEQGSCELPLPITTDDGLRDRELILGIRPEQIGLAGVGTADFSLAVDIEVVEPTGPDTLVVFTLNQVKACCRLMPDQAPQVGETLNLQFDPRKVLLFDAQSGERLGLAQPAVAQESKVTRLVSNGAGTAQ